MPRKPRGHPERAEWAARGLSSHGTPYTKGPYKNSPPGATRGVAGGRAHSAACAQRRQTEQRNAADHADASRQVALAHAADPRVVAYRAEKAARLTRTAGPMREAKRQFEAMLAAQRDAGKGGRPKRVHLKRDPADALLAALGDEQ